MNFETIRLAAGALNLGEIHHNTDPGFFNPEFRCVAADGAEFTVRMRLHATEPLDPLTIVDPRAFADGGVAANSVGSSVLRRRSGYGAALPAGDPVNGAQLPAGVAVYQVRAAEIRRVLLNGYVFPAGGSQPSAAAPEIAFTCHDPSIIGGGNLILFRLVNWLADLGVRVTVYSCGAAPAWTRVAARFRSFASYAAMFAAIEEETVVLYSMWHIEPMLRAQPHGRRIYHLRQIVESYHFGVDHESMLARKPVIEMLESLPLGSIAISPHIQDWYRRELGVESLLVTNGIDLGTFYPVAARAASGGQRHIVSVGDPTHFVKGADVLAKALARLARRRPDLRLHWHVACGQDHRLPGEWSSLARNLEVTAQRGLNQAEMRGLYQGADLFVNPSLYEGFGLPTLEAMACGLPVVQADNAGLDGIVAGGRDCLIVPVHDAEALAGAIERVLMDPALAARLRAESQHTAARTSLTPQFSQFASAFETILSTTFSPERVEQLRPRTPLSASDRQNFSPLVSVVIPSYNQAEYLRQALDSLLAQTYPHWEAVVVNDGSQDHTALVMDEYARRDARIRPFSKPNGGITSALNFGLDQAQGEFFCWLSSDDLFYPGKLAAQVAAFKDGDPELALVYGSFDLLVDEEQRVDVQPFAEPLPAGAEFPEALKFDFIDGCTIMIRMAVMRAVGGFNPYYRHSQDMELWVRIASRGHRFQLLPEKLTIRRIHTAQSSTGNMIHCRYDAAWMIHYYLEHFHLLELYRRFDLTRTDQTERFLDHFVGRVLHTEANVNHPLLQAKFWGWFDSGLAALEPGVQTRILRGCLARLVSYRSATPKVEYYLEACLEALGRERTQSAVDLDFTIVGRDIRLDDRRDDDFGRQLLDYATDLLVNTHTPLFAQELYFHNTHKVVDTPYKLAHSAVRYLSQFPNRFQERVRPHAGFDQIPQTREQALRLFCALRYPEHAALFEAYIGATSTADWDSGDAALGKLPEPLAGDLAQVCGRQPTEPLLHYWNAVTLAAAGDWPAAAKAGWTALLAGPAAWRGHLSQQAGLWAEQARTYERAWSAYQLGLGVDPANPALTAGLRRVARHCPRPQHSQPAPAAFLGRKAPNGTAPARLLDAQLAPQLDGQFTLRLVCQGPNQTIVTTQGSLPYTCPLETIEVTDPAGGRLGGVSPRALFDLWAHAYDFDDQTQAYLRQRGASEAAPAVAFTLLNSSIMGGGPSMVFRYAEWLADLGVAVTIYSNDAPPAGWAGRARFEHIPDEAQRYGAIREAVVIVYSILELPSVLRSNAAAGRRIYHLCQGVEDFNYHGADHPSLAAAKPIFELLHSLPVGRLAVSAHVRDHFEKHYRQRAHTIVNGIDRGVFRARDRRPLANRINVLIVGNPQRLLKGAGDVRQALVLLARRRPEWRLHLNIASGQKVVLTDDAGETAALGFTTTLHIGLSPTEMAELYGRTDVFVNPAWYEGFGLPTLEAMASGVPAVQVDNCGLEGVVRDRQNCLLVKPQSPAGLARAIETLLDDARLRESLIRGGQATAERFGLDQQFEGLVAAFEEILVTRFDPTVVARCQARLKNGGLDDRLIEAARLFQPRFTVLVPTYNQARYLPAALDSLLAQTYPNWEAVIVDDGSTDDTALVMEQYAARDRRFRLFHQPNGGVAAALNEALRNARGEWICWLSSDDLFEPDKLAAHREAGLQFPDVRFFHSHYSFLEETTGRKTEPNPDLHRSMPTLAWQVLRFMGGNYIHGNSIAIHHSVFNQVGFFSPDLRWGQDCDMWLRISAAFPSLFINHRTCVTRLHPEQGTQRFPEACVLDSARADFNFLNVHPLGELFPALALDQRDQVLAVIQATVQVAVAPQSFVNLGGYGGALLDRLHEWLSQSCPAELKPAARALIAGMLLTLEHTAMPEVARAALTGLRSAGADDFHYEPKDALVVMEGHAQTMEAHGQKTGAAPLRRYLDMVRPAEHPTREAATGQAISPAPAGRPLVSVIVPTHNRPGELAKALQSIVAQTYPNLEIVVVNDGGSDVSAVVKRFGTRRPILYEQHPASRGAGAARNTGLRLAQGAYVAFLDDDDLYRPEHLSTLMAEIEQAPNLAAAYSDALQVTLEPSRKKTRVRGRHVAFSVDFSLDELLVRNYIPNLCLLASAQAIRRAGLFDENLSALEDWEWLIRLAQAGPFRHVAVVTAEYVVRPAQQTRNLLAPEQMQQLYETIYRKYAHLAAPAVREAQRRIYAGQTGRDLAVDAPDLFANAPAPAFAPRAVETLQFLLGQPDLAAALQEHADRLDADVLALVRLNADTAKFDKNLELAAGLEKLAEHIELVLAGRPAAGSRAEALLAVLLEAPDLAAALHAHIEAVDGELVSLINQRADRQQAAGDAEGAGALRQLAGYVEQLAAANRSAVDRSPADHARETFELLLEAEDVAEALERYADRLDGDLLDLLRLNEQTARADGEVELANGLEELGRIVLARLAGNPQPV